MLANSVVRVSLANHGKSVITLNDKSVAPGESALIYAGDFRGLVGPVWNVEPTIFLQEAATFALEVRISGGKGYRTADFSVVAFTRDGL